jgi:hypothetical protein
VKMVLEKILHACRQQKHRFSQHTANIAASVRILNNPARQSIACSSGRLTRLFVMHNGSPGQYPQKHNGEPDALRRS